MPTQKARPSFASLAKQIESLTPKTRRAERGFWLPMRKMKGTVRSELRLVRAEARRHVHSLRAAVAEAARRLTHGTWPSPSR